MVSLPPELGASLQYVVAGQVAEAVREIERKIATWVNSHEDVHKTLNARLDSMSRMQWAH